MSKYDQYGSYDSDEEMPWGPDEYVRRCYQEFSKSGQDPSKWMAYLTKKLEERRKFREEQKKKNGFSGSNTGFYRWGK